MRPSFFQHLHPPSIPAPQARFRHTLGAGGLSVYLILVLILSGVLEMFYYIPTPEQAALSIQTLSYLVPFGGFVRNIHYWAAQLLVAVASLHFLRVLFTGAYAPPRRLNYLIGLGLFVLVLFLDFSGYILRWDDGIRWALIAGTNLLKTIPVFGDYLYQLVTGSSSPGPTTLIRFYTWHVFGLTLALIIISVWHLFRVRRDGGIAVPPPGLRLDQNRIPRGELVRREVVAAIFAAVLLVFLASFFPAPIAPPMESTPLDLVDSRAPWFFMWVQQLLRWGDPFLFGIVVPLGIIAIFALIPYLFPKPIPGEWGKWLPRSGRSAQVVAGIIAITLLMLTFLYLISY